MGRPDITAKTIASSMSMDGVRIDTLQLRYPRIIHAEFMTHRMFSRNASSSRAIPTASLISRDEDIFVPDFRYNKAGMQPGGQLCPDDQAEAARIWKQMADTVINGCKTLAAKDGLNVHKQWANRPLEWFGYIDVLVTATEWANWDHLRDHDAAQDEIAMLARTIKAERNRVRPIVLKEYEWHLPYITPEDVALAAQYADDFTSDIGQIFSRTVMYEVSKADALLLIASAARCCRVSYSKHDGTKSNFAEDIERFKKLMPENGPMHATPLEHQASPIPRNSDGLCGNFTGWEQFRKMFDNEALTG